MRMLALVVLLIAHTASAEFARIHVDVVTNSTPPKINVAWENLFVGATNSIAYSYAYEQPYCREMVNRLNDQVYELRRTVSDLTYPKQRTSTLYAWSNVTYSVYGDLSSYCNNTSPVFVYTNSTCFRRIELSTTIEQTIITNECVNEIDL